MDVMGRYSHIIVCFNFLCAARRSNPQIKNGSNSMKYELVIIRKKSGRTLKHIADNDDDLVLSLNYLLSIYPKSDGWEYTITGVVTNHYTLASDFTTGEEALEKLHKMTYNLKE